jgi:hypothetical protein
MRFAAVKRQAMLGEPGADDQGFSDWSYQFMAAGRL